MTTIRLNQGTTWKFAQQAIARVVIGVAIAMGSVVFPRSAHAQDLAARIALIEWAPEALKAQEQEYRARGRKREILYCVEAWHSSDGPGFQRVVIQRVRPEKSGDRYKIRNVLESCRDPNGRSLPTIHSHPTFNCQWSPADMIAIAARLAPFDGVQCGDRYFVWAFSWQVLAVVEWSLLLQAHKWLTP